MFTWLEGKSKHNYQACNEKGDLTPEKILQRMDMIYGRSVSFRDLKAKLCGLKQGQLEPPKDYYESMNAWWTSVLLWRSITGTGSNLESLPRWKRTVFIQASGKTTNIWFRTWKTGRTAILFSCWRKFGKVRNHNTWCPAQTPQRPLTIDMAK